MCRQGLHEAELGQVLVQLSVHLHPHRHAAGDRGSPAVPAQ